MRDASRAPAGPLLIAWSGAAAFVASLGYFLYSYIVRFGATAGPAAPLAAAGIDLLLFSAFALHHSLFARSGVKARVRLMVPPELERSLYTWAASLLFVLVCWLWKTVPGELYHAEGAAAAPFLAVQAAGIVLAAASSARLDVLDLAGVRAVLDAGRDRRPAHVPLETRGLYALVRHPVYLGWALFVFGAPHMTLTRLTFAVVSTAYLAIAIPFEERGLAGTFGAPYRAYQERVRWRMIPGIY